jgi:hypothetical protein
MQTSNAVKLCEDRGFPWQLTLRNNRISFDIGTSDGWYNLPAGDAFEVQAGRGNVNGDILAMILKDHEPPKGFNNPVKRG